jgi:uncharacterized protein DUF4154
MIALLRRTVFSICLLIASSHLFAQEKIEEAHLKAALIKNIISFTRWPSQSFERRNSPLLMCIVGKDPYSKIFAKLPSLSLQNRSLQTMQLDLDADLVTIRDCHVVLVLLKDQQETSLFIHKIRELPVLTISELDIYESQQSMVNLAGKDDRITFSVNRQTANQVGLDFSSRLLRFAHHIIGGGM